MRICAKCSSKVEPNQNFCPHCRKGNLIVFAICTAACAGFILVGIKCSRIGETGGLPLFFYGIAALFGLLGLNCFANALPGVAARHFKVTEKPSESGLRMGKVMNDSPRQVTSPIPRDRLDIEGKSYVTASTALEFVTQARIGKLTSLPFHPDKCNTVLQAMIQACQERGIDGRKIFEPTLWVCTRCSVELPRDVAFLFWSRNQPNAPAQIIGGSSSREEIDRFKREKACPHCGHDEFAFLSLGGGENPDPIRDQIRAAQKLLREHIDGLKAAHRSFPHFETVAARWEKLLEHRVSDCVSSWFVEKLKSALENDESLTTRVEFPELNLTVGISLVPAFDSAQARAYFTGGYLGSFEQLLNQTSFPQGKIDFAHWIFCANSQGCRAHLTFFPALEIAKTAFGMWAIDLLTPDEKRMVNMNP